MTKAENILSTCIESFSSISVKILRNIFICLIVQPVFFVTNQIQNENEFETAIFAPSASLFQFFLFPFV